MTDIAERLAAIVGVANVRSGAAISEDDTHDEALTAEPQVPAHVVRPASADEVAEVVALAVEQGIPLTARGSGTGLSGACIPVSGGILVSFERMAEILEIDLHNHVAVVQPGVTLDQLDRATAEHGLVYPVFPGESSASLGGNVATNAGGMRAVKYGVTRHHVLGVQAVLGTGEVIRTGGKVVKCSSGYDLTQTIIGSEGTLALVTEATLKLYPRPAHAATVLAPFATLEAVTAGVAPIVQSGIGPLVVEYIDLIAMGGIVASAGLELGIPDEVKGAALAYLVVVLEQHDQDRLEADVEALGTLLADLGALDVYVLPAGAGADLIAAREKVFFTAKAAGADDIIDVVVPRASISAFMDRVGALAAETGSLIPGCGHVGDGNVHVSVFQGDPEVRSRLLQQVFQAAIDLGGAVSGEHGIGTEKKGYYLALEDPAKVALMRRIKQAFDPHGILNPGTIFDQEPTP